MSRFLQLVFRVVRSRRERGEELEEILRDYPHLTQRERDMIRKQIGGKT